MMSQIDDPIEIGKASAKYKIGASKIVKLIRQRKLQAEIPPPGEKLEANKPTSIGKIYISEKEIKKFATKNESLGQ